MNKSLDKAIMKSEMQAYPSLKSGYIISNRNYENYLSNDSWDEFKANMKRFHPLAFEMFSFGGGKELEERITAKSTYPPKMASFGSSSRMIYNIMKDNPCFLFEKKLPTTVGGISNLDGFIETDEKCVFVEAKCREPYSTKNKTVAIKYLSLYRRLKSLNCSISCITDSNMQVDFSSSTTEINHFDIKQMICHLLGVATAYLNGIYSKPIDFIYLLYNPTELEIENKAHKEEILRIYKETCNEFKKIDFYSLFLEILSFLQKEMGLGKEKNITDISKLFSIRMEDQNTMK